SELHARLQHDRRDAGQRRRAAPPAPQRRRQQVLHVRPRPPELSVAQSPGSRGRADGAAWHAAHRNRLGGRAHRRSAAAVGQADAVVLPIANFVEEEGTFTNLRGRVQRFFQAKAAPGFARPSWYALTDLLAALGAAAPYALPRDVFAALATARPEFAGLSYE